MLSLSHSRGGRMEVMHSLAGAPLRFRGTKARYGTPTGSAAAFLRSRSRGGCFCFTYGVNETCSVLLPDRFCVCDQSRRRGCRTPLAAAADPAAAHIGRDKRPANTARASAAGCTVSERWCGSFFRQYRQAGPRGEQTKNKENLSKGKGFQE